MEKKHENYTPYTIEKTYVIKRNESKRLPFFDGYRPAFYMRKIEENCTRRFDYKRS